jgi:hypothetical protein
MKIKIILSVGLLLFSFIGCSSSELMISKVPKTKIVVDGNHEDWNGKLKYFEDEKAAIGFQNDEDYLYFCLVTADKANAKKIMALGLTVWFQPSGDEETIGLVYPLRMDNISPKSLMGMNRNNNGDSDFDMTVFAMMQNQGELELINDDDEILYSAALGSNEGFKIKVAAVNQQFVYEAQVPIGNNELAQIPINVFPNEKINVEFETGEINFDEMRGSGGMQGQGMGKGGGGGMQGGGQGGRGSMQSGGRSGQSRMGMERFRLEVDLKLAK